MAITTTLSQVKLARDLKAKANPYFAIGRSTAWTNEKLPPIPNKSTTSLEEVIGYKKVESVFLCRPIKPKETTNYQRFYYNNQEWVKVPDANAEAEGATYVGYETKLNPTDFPLGTYRQVGIHIGLTPKSGVTKNNLLPSEVNSKGYLHAYENTKPINRIENVTITERFIISVE